MAARRIELHVSPEASALLAREGFDPAFGARPLKRVIQRELGDRLAMALLEGTIADGDEVTVGVEDDQISIAWASPLGRSGGRDRGGWACAPPPPARSAAIGRCGWSDRIFGGHARASPSSGHLHGHAKWSSEMVDRGLASAPHRVGRPI